MRSRTILLTLAVVAGCAAPPPAPSPPNQTATSTSATGGAAMSATRVRFATADAEVLVELTDSPTTRDLLSTLPLTLDFEDFGGKEKISYLPKKLTADGSPGSTPRNGTLIYYVPWGNLGFYYNASGGHDDNLITLGSVESGMDQLHRLEQGQVTVTAVT